MKNEVIIFKSWRKLLPISLKQFIKHIYNNYFDGYALKSYSQEGEDMVLRRIFQKKSKGFFVDVGAHHPKRFSNTYYFYKLGWNGINIEPNPKGLALLKTFRPRDINLQFGVSDTEGFLDYFMFDEPALNTLDKDLAQEYSHHSRLLSTIQIKLSSLKNILEKNLPKNTSIDFMSIDVEGFDYSVLISNDWEKYRPSYVIVEALDQDLMKMLDSDIVKFMKNVSYEPYAMTVNSVFFKNSQGL